MSQPDATIYDKVAPRWWNRDVRWLRVLQGLAPVRLDLFAPIVGTWAATDVLDLGCGGGFMSEELTLRGARVTGVDPSSAAIEAAREHARGEALDIDYKVGVGEAIPAPACAFDIVVCVDVFEHVDDLRGVAHEIARVLRPGGVLLFDTINRTALARLVMITVGENILRLLPRGTHDYRRFIRPEELRSVLAEAGLSMGLVVGLGPRSVTRRLDLVFGRVPLAAILYLGHAHLGPNELDERDHCQP